MASVDFFGYEPTKQDKVQMRKVEKRPSEWLHLLCKEWVTENEIIVNDMDAKFLEYKPYTRGVLSSQLLCRLSIPPSTGDVSYLCRSTQSLDFWQTLGIKDSFDRSYIMAQVERFCFLYSIHCLPLEHIETDIADYSGNESMESVMITDSCHDFASLVHDHAGVANIAAADITARSENTVGTELNESASGVSSSLQEDSTDIDKVDVVKREYRNKESKLKKEKKLREREALAVQKATVRAIRQSSRADRRQRRLEIRTLRESYAKQQKDAALKRAAELVESDRIPLDIIRGSVTTKAVEGLSGHIADNEFHRESFNKRSAIIVSTAGDLFQIVTHSNNLWAKYNAIAKEHNQRVSWATVASELGIHVKVREKYARMYATAEKHGFNWIQNAHWKIRDHPEIFLAGAAEASSVGKKSRGTSNSRHTVPLESLPVSKSEVMNVVPIEVREDSISLVSAEALTTPPTYEDHGNGI